MTGWELRQYMLTIDNVGIDGFNNLTLYRLMPDSIFANIYMKDTNTTIYEVGILLYDYALILSNFFSTSFDIVYAIGAVPIEYREGI